MSECPPPPSERQCRKSATVAYPECCRPNKYRSVNVFHAFQPSEITSQAFPSLYEIMFDIYNNFWQVRGKLHQGDASLHWHISPYHCSVGDHVLQFLVAYYACVYVSNTSLSCSRDDASARYPFTSLRLEVHSFPTGTSYDRTSLCTQEAFDATACPQISNIIP